jgi:DNA primase
LDENGDAYHLRPHKLGFEGRPVELYCQYLLKDKPSEIVLTEGEFKAAALLQWGIPAIAMPGISAFGGKHFDRLVDLLKGSEVKKVTVIFDNEIKDNPDFPNYKEKPESRYDVELWSYLLAYRLFKAGFTARIAKLPDEWRREGKVDFDSALAQGYTKEEILKVTDTSQTHKEYLESLPEASRRIVQRKISRHFNKVPIKREFNRYVAIRSTGRGEKRNIWEETISNFVLNIKSSFFTPDGVIRNVQLVNEYGETSETFALSPGEMAGLNEWKKFCFSKGNFVFEGNTQDLLNVWKLEFLRDIGDLIYMPDRIGYIEDRNLWLFGNMAIKNGKIYRPDNDGIIWIKGRGYKPQSLQIGARGEAIEDAIPSLSERKIDIKEIAQKMKQTIGGYEAYVGIGWVIATIFSSDIFKYYKCMPILFPHGKRESGKSTFMRWLMAFFGIETEGVGIAETTQNFIARSLSYFSGLGAWFDEYRNEYRVIQKDGFFRSAYNRQMSGKGTATAFQARGFSVHASVAISGEELPKDNGLFTRLVPLQVSAYKRDRTWYEWFNRHAQEFSSFTLYLLLNYEELKPKILTNIAELKKALLQKDISDRTAENWAICTGCFDTVVFQDDEFISWVEQACQEVKLSGENEHMLNQFLSDILVLIIRDEINEDYITYEEEGKLLCIWLSGVYNAWAMHYRSKTGREPFDEHSIRKYLQDEPYYKGTDRIYFKNSRRRAVIIDVETAPEIVQDIASEVK